VTNRENKELCLVLARLFSPPDHELVKEIHQGTIYTFLQEYVRSWGRDRDTSLLNGFIMEGPLETLVTDLQEEYGRLFSGCNTEGICLVESFYKPWTRDTHCTLPFASERGLLMGDAAIHLLEIYRTCNLEIAEEFKGCPDHLIMELEFLSYLYEQATESEVRRFLEDHLDWIPLLQGECERHNPHPLYKSLLGVLNLFLTVEKRRLEMDANG
jgi:TorA maturation chaperone TorD